MRQICAAPFALALMTNAAFAQEPPSMMERGAQMFFEGLMQEMAPALDELGTLLEETGPALQEFVAEMGPKFQSVLEDVEDWSAYAAPEVLPNGDIIIRRKSETPVPDPLDPPETVPVPSGPQIDL